MKKHKKEYIHNVKRSRRERELKNLENFNTNDDGKPKRFVLVKYEDFYYEQYEYAGKKQPPDPPIFNFLRHVEKIEQFDHWKKTAD